MGSIEVFDYQQMKWVPYVPPPDKAEQYYTQIRDAIGKTSHSSESVLARQLRETSDKLRVAEEKLKRKDEQIPTTKQVTPVVTSSA